MDDSERSILGLMAFCYQNTKLMRDMSRIMIDNPEHPLTKFYRDWCHKNKYPTTLPLNPGTFWMISSAVILSARQKWKNLIPDVEISDLGKSWGLSNAKITSEKYCDPSLKYVLRKMRNALAHINIHPKIPKEVKTQISYSDLYTKSFFTLIDDKVKRDYFEITLSYRDLSLLNAQIYKLISDHIQSINK